MRQHRGTRQKVHDQDTRLHQVCHSEITKETIGWKHRTAWYDPMNMEFKNGLNWCNDLPLVINIGIWAITLLSLFVIAPTEWTLRISIGLEFLFSIFLKYFVKFVENPLTNLVVVVGRLLLAHSKVYYWKDTPSMQGLSESIYKKWNIEKHDFRECESSRHGSINVHTKVDQSIVSLKHSTHMLQTRVSKHGIKLVQGLPNHRIIEHDFSLYFFVIMWWNIKMISLSSNFLWNIDFGGAVWVWGVHQFMKKIICNLFA